MAILHVITSKDESVKTTELVNDLAVRYETFKEPKIVSRRFTQSELLAWIAPLVADGDIRSSVLGHSTEGRAISLYTIGTGPTKVLLWSQMHGDEPTATMALVDIFRFLLRHADHPVAAAIRQRLTLLVVPMLNPDGAERFVRRTAQLIDMNRDALALQTPEARILKELQQRERPAVGFNLHDQDTHYMVGTTGKHTAIALLAPPVDEARSDSAVRTRAKHIAALIVEALGMLAPGHVAKWDDTFEPRAFGDNVQRWGTSTVLIESGAWPGDPEKMALRKLNAVALLAALRGIAEGAEMDAPRSLYEDLPFNMKLMCDLIIRNASYRASHDGPAVTVDVGINYEDEVGERGALVPMARIVELGDLRTFRGFEERDAGGRSLNREKVLIDKAFLRAEVNGLLGNFF
jgi:predicted deacylase